MAKKNVSKGVRDVKNKNYRSGNGKNENGKKFKYLKFEKLVRDRNPDTITKSGGECIYYNLQKDDFIRHLKLKLIEEAQEVFDAKDLDEMIDEMGDVVEVLKSLIRVAKIRKFKIWKARRKKAKQRGGFKKGIYCRYVKFPTDITEKWMWKYEDITSKIEAENNKKHKEEQTRKQSGKQVRKQGKKNDKIIKKIKK